MFKRPTLAVAALLAPLSGWAKATFPSVELQNAAQPGTLYPMTGLGLNGPGYEIPNTGDDSTPQPQCWHYPSCCTADYCPAVNATRDYLMMGGPRLDTGYPYGDASPLWGPEVGKTCGGWNRSDDGSSTRRRRRLGHECDPHGIRAGMLESGVARDDMFITIKSGFAGPMAEIDQGCVPSL